MSPTSSFPSATVPAACSHVLLTVMSLLATPAPVFATVVTDGFEGPVISSLWDVSLQNHGSIGLSTTVAHSGSQSLQVMATGGGQVDAWAFHDFGQPMLGEFSTWFYDTRNGSVYSHIVLQNTQDNASAFIGIQDWDASYYHAGYGPNEGKTTVPRSIGWHHFKITADGTSHSFYIDSVLVSSAARTGGFDRLALQISGPGVVGTYYYDDFSAIVQPVPEPSTYALAAIGIAATSLLRLPRLRCR